MSINRPKAFAALAGVPVLGWPEREAMIPALAQGERNEAPKTENVELLGHKGKLRYSHDATGLKLVMSDEKPSDHAVAMHIDLA
jgi:hypothetical protein